MRNGKSFIVIISIVLSGFFVFTVNISFAKSLQVNKDKIEQYSFSSPAAEGSFLETGQIEKNLSLATTVKTMLSSLDDRDLTSQAQRSTGCTVGCTVGCTAFCAYGTTGCTVGCSEFCTDTERLRYARKELTVLPESVLVLIIIASTATMAIIMYTCVVCFISPPYSLQD